jgi:rhodanese-related sulfurtransferase
MKLTWFLLAAVQLAVACPSWSNSYHYIRPDQLHGKLNSGSSMILIDISPAALFSQKHIPGSIKTQAFPVKTTAEKTRLDKVLPLIDASDDTAIIIICPRGGQSAQRAFDHLKARGVNSERMKILAGGILAWPHASQRNQPIEPTPFMPPNQPPATSP